MSDCDEHPGIALDEVDSGGPEDNRSESPECCNTMLDGDGNSDESDCVLAEVVSKSALTQTSL